MSNEDLRDSFIEVNVSNSYNISVNDSSRTTNSRQNNVDYVFAAPEGNQALTENNLVFAIIFSFLASVLGSLPLCTYTLTSDTKLFLISFAGHFLGSGIFPIRKLIGEKLLTMIVGFVSSLLLFYVNNIEDSKKTLVFAILGTFSGFFLNSAYIKLTKYSHFKYSATIMAVPLALYYSTPYFVSVKVFLMRKFNIFRDLNNYGMNIYFSAMYISITMVLLLLLFLDPELEKHRTVSLPEYQSKSQSSIDTNTNANKSTDNSTNSSDDINNSNRRQMLMGFEDLNLDFFSLILLSFFLSGYYINRFYNIENGSFSQFYSNSYNQGLGFIYTTFGIACVFFFSLIFDYVKNKYKHLYSEEFDHKNLKAIVRKTLIAICFETLFLVFSETMFKNLKHKLESEESPSNFVKFALVFLDIMIFGEGFALFFAVPYFGATNFERNFIAFLMFSSDFFTLCGAAFYHWFNYDCEHVKTYVSILVCFISTVVGEMLMWYGD